jgi:hypothetical protein
MPSKDHENKLFSGCFGPFIYQNGPIDSVGLIFKLRHRAVHPAHLLTFEYLFGSIWVCPNAPKHQKKLIIGVIFLSVFKGVIKFYFGSSTSYLDISCPK